LSFLAYRIVRSRRRLEPFDSPQLDELAERMGVLKRLNKKQRYFFSRRTYSAFSFPGGIAFGKWYWDSLDDGERTAIAAHEFSHIKSNDGVKRFLRIALPSLVITLAIMIAISSILPYTASAFVLEGVGVGMGTVLVFMLSYTLLSLINAPWRRRTELDCDADAAKYANGEDLIRALFFWESVISQKVRKTIRYRILSRYYPTLAQRTEAIRAVAGNTAVADVQ
jgi:Zn-dependent protease with chaperone function